MVIAITACAFAQSKEIQTPDDLYIAIVAAAGPDQGDISWTGDHVTPIGKETLSWLLQQKFFESKPKAKILERKDDTGQSGRYELIVQYRYDDGYEKVSIIFFKESGVWKFHDVYLFDMKGARFDMFLSYVVREPIKSRLLFASRNPSIVMKTLGSAADGFSGNLFIWWLNN